MKKLLSLLLLSIFLFTACYKEEDCSQTVQCWTIKYAFTICDTASGVYNFKNIRADTSYSTQSICKTDWYINTGYQAEKEFYNKYANDVQRAFIDTLPIQCGCNR